jgi:hypothetical protein
MVKETNKKPIVVIEYVTIPMHTIDMNSLGLLMYDIFITEKHITPIKKDIPVSMIIARPGCKKDDRNKEMKFLRS